MDLSGIASTLLYGGLDLLAAVIALVLVLSRARGRARSIGLLGAVLFLVGAIISPLTSLLLPLMMNRLHLSYSLVGVVYLPINLIHAAAVVLLAFAVGVNHRQPSAPGPYPPQPPYAS